MEIFTSELAVSAPFIDGEGKLMPFPRVPQDKINQIEILLALTGEAIECVEEDQPFSFHWWWLRHSCTFMKNSPIIKVKKREKKMYFIINHITYLIYSFNRAQTLITFL